jgi:hypothetical protein
MKRLDLVHYRKGSLTSDTVEALRHLELRTAKADKSFVLHVSSRGLESMKWGEVRENPGPTGCRPEWSAVPTGREIYLRLEINDDQGHPDSKRERELALLWGLAIPLGFTPWVRYPLPGPGDDVFHYYGPWRSLMDSLMGMGRGEEAWPSFCCAAQVDVGAWEGNRPTERFVQAQLHRMGYNHGPVDGMVGPRTETALKGAGLHGLALSEAAKKLTSLESKPAQRTKKRKGHIVLPETNFSITSYGQVRTIQTAQGAAVELDGPGRIIITTQE